MAILMSLEDPYPLIHDLGNIERSSQGHLCADLVPAPHLLAGFWRYGSLISGYSRLSMASIVHFCHAEWLDGPNSCEKQQEMLKILVFSSQIQQFSLCRAENGATADSSAMARSPNLLCSGSIYYLTILKQLFYQHHQYSMAVLALPCI